MIRFDDILDKVSARFGEKDIALLQKAYVFSAQAHKGQVRRSGEPYLSHPARGRRPAGRHGPRPRRPSSPASSTTSSRTPT